MYELEVPFSGNQQERPSPELQSAFLEGQQALSQFEAVSVLQWEEHCTECAMPECYRTCDLYAPRKDGKCRRFVSGIVPVAMPSEREHQVVHITFKQWGALMADNLVSVLPREFALTYEKSAARAERIARAVPDGWLSILGRRGVSSRLTRRYKLGLSARAASRDSGDAVPTAFVIEIFNANDAAVDLTFSVRARVGDKNATPYQERLIIGKGYHFIEIPYDQIQPHIEEDVQHYIQFVPNIEEPARRDTSLYFGFLGFVRVRPAADATRSGQPGNAKAAKVVVWDLDNTIWNGILAEDGPEGLRLNEGIEEVIKTLDRRGIVNSIASKNNYEDAWAQLEAFGLSEYFVFPEIDWCPKSESLQKIIKAFNVGADTVVFVDDSPFERNEIQAVHPAIRAIDSREYPGFLDRPEFNPRISAESSSRRAFYQSQSLRADAMSDFAGDYDRFLKSCDIRIVIEPGSGARLERINELVQRTNQLNFSGNRYSRELLDEILLSSNLDTFSLTAEDKFGLYGTVGFCVVDRHSVTMTDLMLSCRVQSKRVEHAFLGWLLKRYADAGQKLFTALYNRTERNVPAGRVFSDLGFHLEAQEGDRLTYTFDLTGNLPDQSLITITYEALQARPVS